jgi:hypothetical protein
MVVQATPMSVSSNPAVRSSAHALVVTAAASRGGLVESLARLGFECAQSDDPYAAMRELCHRPLVYRVLVLGLAGVYREELAIIPAVKRRLPHIEIYLAQTDGRQAALAEAMRLGADGLVDVDGVHRLGGSGVPLEPAPDLARHGEPAGRVRSSTGAAAAVSMPGPAQPSSADGASSDEAADDAAMLNDGPIHEPVLTAEELRALLQEQPTPDAEGQEG